MELTSLKATIAISAAHDVTTPKPGELPRLIMPLAAHNTINKRHREVQYVGCRDDKM
jgi:hypothetical protein